MGIMCVKCKHIHKANALPSKCEECGQSDIDQFIRVEDEDFDEGLYTKEKEWLESRKKEVVVNETIHSEEE